MEGWEFYKQYRRQRKTQYGTIDLEDDESEKNDEEEYEEDGAGDDSHGDGVSISDNTGSVNFGEAFSEHQRNDDGKLPLSSTVEAQQEATSSIIDWCLRFLETDLFRLGTISVLSLLVAFGVAVVFPQIEKVFGLIGNRVFIHTVISF